jgi:hypothetical protein
MKSLALLFLAAAIALFITLTLFKEGFGHAVFKLPEESATKTADGKDTNKPYSSGSTSSPVTNFHGPTGDPHIIGPSGPPPNH